MEGGILSTGFADGLTNRWRLNMNMIIDVSWGFAAATAL